MAGCHSTAIWRVSATFHVRHSCAQYILGTFNHFVEATDFIAVEYFRFEVWQKICRADSSAACSANCSRCCSIMRGLHLRQFLGTVPQHRKVMCCECLICEEVQALQRMEQNQAKVDHSKARVQALQNRIADNRVSSLGKHPSTRLDPTVLPFSFPNPLYKTWQQPQTEVVEYKHHYIFVIRGVLNTRAFFRCPGTHARRNLSEGKDHISILQNECMDDNLSRRLLPSPRKLIGEKSKSSSLLCGQGGSVCALSLACVTVFSCVCARVRVPACRFPRLPASRLS